MNIIIVMHRRAIAQSIVQVLNTKPGFNAYLEASHTNTLEAIRRQNAKVALIEVSEDGKHDVVYCLALAEQIKMEFRSCKVIMMCPEQNKTCVDAVITAKRENRIDEFVFYDTTIEYLATKLMSM
jgi:hypothetical protein